MSVRGVNPVAILESPSPLDLVELANREHGLALRSHGDTVGHAINAGEALLAAKAQLAHGEWLPWLAVNFKGSEWTAQAYMRLAANPRRVTDLEGPSLRNALRAIAPPKPTPNEDDGHAELPAGPFWQELLASRDAIRRLSVVNPGVLAAAVPARRRRQFAKDLRAVGRVLGTIASHLED